MPFSLEGGDTYDHLEKIGIRGTTFQLGNIEFFSAGDVTGDVSDPADLQIMSFDNPAASNMNQYEWYSNDVSTQATLHYLPEGNYLQVSGQPSASSAQGLPLRRLPPQILLHLRLRQTISLFQIIHPPGHPARYILYMYPLPPHCRPYSGWDIHLRYLPMALALSRSCLS